MEISHVLFLLCFFANPGESDSGIAITRGPFQKTLALHGEIISPKSEKFYTPRTKNWEIQLEWMLPEGTAVQPGDVVVRFDNSAVKEELETATNDLLTKMSDRELKVMEIEQSILDQELKTSEAEVKLKKAEIDAAIPKGLEELRTYQEKQLAVARARKEYDQHLAAMKTTLANSETDLKILDLSIRDLEKKVEQAEKDQDKLELTATSSGIVVWEDHPWEGRKLQLGESVRPSWSVARIPAMEDMEVEAYASESEVSQIQPGQPVTLVPDAYPNLIMHGQVQAVANNAVVRDRFGAAPYFRIQIKPSDLDTSVIKPGMSVRSEILLIDRKDALLIPIQMIRFDGGAYFVKPEGGKLKEIKPLGFNDFYVAVLPEDADGLKEGDGLEAAAPNE